MITLRPGITLVEVVRSGVVESVHSGHLVVLDGEDVIELGDPRQPLFPRSANKPLQAVGMRRHGLAVPPPQLALAAASHSGEPRHVDLVRAMLASGGFSEDDLGCPPAWPLDDAARTAWSGPRRICMNCSGKHAAMLLTCRANGWPVESYLASDHPLQRALHLTVEELADDPVAAVGVDGCGAPLFAVSLIGVARAYRRIATAGSGPERDVADAMRAHPELVGGSGRVASRLMASVPGLVAKDGAEGVFAAALPSGAAVAVKIDDGALRAAERAVVAGLCRTAAAPAVLGELATAPVLGGGEPVGTVRFREGLLRRR
jgi:L-asparaginase II